MSRCETCGRRDPSFETLSGWYDCEYSRRLGYAEGVLAERIKPIRTDEDHKKALAEIERLWSAEEGSPEGDRLEVLATLVNVYEEEIEEVEETRKAVSFFLEMEKGLALLGPDEGLSEDWGVLEELARPKHENEETQRGDEESGEVGEMSDNEETQRRVLDMLAGWEHYVRIESEQAENEVEAHALLTEADAIWEIYQQVGAADTVNLDAVLKTVQGILLCGGGL